MKVWIDGQGISIEGQNARALVLFEDGYKTVKEENLGTNNEMEYTALIEALNDDRCENGSIIYTDSQLLVGQLVYNWKVKAKNLINLHKIAKEKLQEKNCELVWIPRKENEAGKMLERMKQS